MRSLRAALLLAITLSQAISLPAFAAKAASKAAPAKGAAGVSDASVAACAAEFVDALNSLDDERVLASLSPSDRVALRGRSNLIGLVFGKKILDPQVKSFEKVERDGKLLGAKAVVSVNEVDPLELTKSAKDHTWFMALDEKNMLKVSLSSVWLDTGKIGSPE